MGRDIDHIEEVSNMENDLISRQDAIDAMTNTLWHYPNECYRNLNEYEFAKGLAELGLKSVPSAQPERKPGKWLIRKFGANAQCSECKMSFSDVYDLESSDAYCRHCGTKMEGLKVITDE